MQVRVIGGHGGVAPGYRASSYLIDNKLLIDAGSVATGISIQEQADIDYFLISHSHLDHIKDLAFICDNCFSLRKKPFQVYCHTTTKNAIKTHLFNEVIWPDFSVLPSPENAVINL
jgi:cAMP phosphodiesterase